MPRALPVSPMFPPFDFLDVYAGKQLEHVFLFTDDDDVAQDLTGYTASGKVVDENNVTVITLVIAVGGTEGTLSIDQLISAAVPPGRLDWKMELVDSGGDVSVRLKGKFNVEEY